MEPVRPPVLLAALGALLAAVAPAAAASPPRVALLAAGHAPRVGAAWPYAVVVTDAAGRPLPGRLHARILLGTLPVGEVGRHSFDGIWAESLTWPAAAEGQAVTLELAVSAGGATTTLRYPVTPRAGTPLRLVLRGHGAAVAAARRPVAFRARGEGAAARWTVACNRGARTLVRSGRGPVPGFLPLPGYHGEDCAAGVLAAGASVAAR